ncbi:FecR family protein [Luteimonas rhizosphaerae]|uniref:FecR family protein n=2 Tax=Luteimonas TaxID=83614 RepID=UPI000C7DD9B6|nr:FecR domain-containing protein [Luteimonas sp. 4-12]
MSKVLGLPVAVWLACVAWPLAASDLHVALVKGVAGSVSIVQANATRTAEAGTQLRVSDRIVTAPGATASIVFRDGTMLTVGGGADVHVRDYVFEPKAGRYAFSLYMGQGSAIYESGKIGRLAPESVKVETPQATVGVRGTRFLIEAG